MSEETKQRWADGIRGIQYWKLAIWKLYAGTFITTSGIATGLIMAWDKMTPPERLISIIAGLVTLHKFWDGFLDQTVARLVAGKTIIPIDGNGHSGEIVKTITETKTTIT